MCVQGADFMSNAQKTNPASAECVTFTEARSLDRQATLSLSLYHSVVPIETYYLMALTNCSSPLPSTCVLNTHVHAAAADPLFTPSLTHAPSSVLIREGPAHVPPRQMASYLEMIKK